MRAAFGAGHPVFVALGLLLAGGAICNTAAAADHKIYGCAVITEPGNYLLVTDIIVDETCLNPQFPPQPDPFPQPQGLVGIHIAASDVHLNLGGHTVYGSPFGYGPGVPTRGIDTSSAAAVSNVKISNGRVDGMGVIGDGIYVDGASATSVINVESTNNLRFGMALAFCTDCTVTGSAFFANGNAGTQTVFSERITIRGNTFADNPFSNGLTIGVFPGPHKVIGNTFTGNGGGIGEFIAAGPAGHLIQGNAVRDNLFRGMRICTSENTIRANQVTDNGGNGISIESRCFFFPVPSVDNTIQANRAVGNSGDDMADDNGDCVNDWKANTFETDSEGDGPRRGCIR